MNITNRLLSLNTFSNGLQVGETVNAGGSTVRGVDAMVSTTPVWGGFSPYMSFSYVHATTDNNLPVASTSGTVDYLRSAGKRAVMTPSIMGALGVSYDNRNLFVNASVHYTGRQYSTFMNDQHIPGYWSDSIAIGYKFPKFLLRRPRNSSSISQMLSDHT